MAENRTYNYEALFLLSQAQAADLNGVVAQIKDVFARANASLIAMKKWDERRLAYEIKKQKRGVYILAYFACPARAMSEVERAFNLSEKITRYLIIRADHLTPEEMQAADAQKELEVEARLRAERPAGAEREQPVGAAPADPAEQA